MIVAIPTTLTLHRPTRSLYANPTGKSTPSHSKTLYFSLFFSTFLYFYLPYSPSRVPASESLQFRERMDPTVFCASPNSALRITLHFHETEIRDRNLLAG